MAPQAPQRARASRQSRRRRPPDERAHAAPKHGRPRSNHEWKVRLPFWASGARRCSRCGRFLGLSLRRADRPRSQCRERRRRERFRPPRAAGRRRPALVAAASRVARGARAPWGLTASRLKGFRPPAQALAVDAMEPKKTRRRSSARSCSAGAWTRPASSRTSRTAPARAAAPLVGVSNARALARRDARASRLRRSTRRSSACPRAPETAAAPAAGDARPRRAPASRRRPRRSGRGAGARAGRSRSPPRRPRTSRRSARPARALRRAARHVRRGRGGRRGETERAERFGLPDEAKAMERTPPSRRARSAQGPRRRRRGGQARRAMAAKDPALKAQEHAHSGYGAVTAPPGAQPQATRPAEPAAGAGIAGCGAPPAHRSSRGARHRQPPPPPPEVRLDVRAARVPRGRIVRGADATTLVGMRAI